MNIESAEFTRFGGVSAVVDGAPVTVPADPNNRVYAAIAELVDAGDLVIAAAATDLAAEKALAKAEFIRHADRITAAILARYPAAETAGWPVKQAEAVMILGGRPVSDTVLIKAIAAAKGLKTAGVKALAESIVAKATEFAAIAAAVEMLRSDSESAIDGVKVAADLPAILKALKVAADAVAADLGLA